MNNLNDIKRFLYDDNIAIGMIVVLVVALMVLGNSSPPNPPPIPTLTPSLPTPTKPARSTPRPTSAATKSTPTKPTPSTPTPILTPSQETAILTPSPISSPEGHDTDSCSPWPPATPVLDCDNFTSDLSAGKRAVIDWQELNVRQEPFVPEDHYSNIITTLKRGETLTVIDGIVCAHDGYWWKIQGDLGVVGWVREKNRCGEVYVQPID